jgi:hypothetical protein
MVGDGVAAFGDFRGQAAFRLLEQEVADQQNRQDDQQRDQQAELNLERQAEFGRPP